jgi:hypothetical protein
LGGSIEFVRKERTSDARFVLCCRRFFVSAGFVFRRQDGSHSSRTCADARALHDGADGDTDDGSDAGFNGVAAG